MSVISHQDLLLTKLADPVTGLGNGQPFYIYVKSATKMESRYGTN
ncbi:hypothetical protein [Chroococcidiopsis sp. CCMEE 29]|nr:hypothetical protein [Chroococcidiopsis sp. CCMEE 29]